MNAIPGARLQPRVMLLVDCDNVSASVVDQAIAHVLARNGAIHVRRAYCTAESAVAQATLFKRHSMRPIVNLSTGKNSTDIALAVDAIDLVLAERPDVVVIVSSDSDFAPLVIRLREKGCRVEGIGQLGKTGDDAKPVYDAFVDLAHERAPKAEKQARAAKAAPPRPAAAPRAAPAPAKAARAKARADALPDEVVSILAAVPGLLGGAAIELRVAAEALRGEKLLARSAPSTRLFRKYPALFALSPDKQPHQVRYIGGASA